MDRLTKWKDGALYVLSGLREWLVLGGRKGMYDDAIRTAIERLAAYEDTGLSPEQCAEMAKAEAEGRLVPPIMREAITFIVEERFRQIAKWGDQSENHPFEWMSILTEEVGELAEAVNETCVTSQHKRPEKGGASAILREATHIAAVAVAIAEAALKEREG